MLWRVAHEPTVKATCSVAVFDERLTPYIIQRRENGLVDGFVQHCFLHELYHGGIEFFVTVALLR